ncbi:hypothetical protein F5Y10DRAFT_205654 [Nemania abortiva]|nr:hypothetical protein F5Y10DRAFT_205654 [Nemania abortiva]
MEEGSERDENPDGITLSRLCYYLERVNISFQVESSVFYSFCSAPPRLLHYYFYSCRSFNAHALFVLLGDRLRHGLFALFSSLIYSEHCILWPLPSLSRLFVRFHFDLEPIFVILWLRLNPSLSLVVILATYSLGWFVDT